MKDEFGDAVRVLPAFANDKPGALGDFLTDIGLRGPVLLDQFDPACSALPDGETSLYRWFLDRVGMPDDPPFPLQAVIAPDGTFAWLSREHHPEALIALLHEVLGD